ECDAYLPETERARVAERAQKQKYLKFHERLSRLDTASSSTGTSDAHSDRPSGRSSAYSRRENRLAALSSKTEDDSAKDYKKLYESALSENQKLKLKLQDAQLELADVKTKIDKIAQQKQEKTSDRSSMLELEKREKRALERKLSEMEEEMKPPQILWPKNGSFGYRQQSDVT
uniref:Protein phosphatase 1 regulatory subunit 12B n=1 Tax=Salvator merianae TaxID=96440 RepID=A0A8D0BEB8_SALMN